VTLSTTVGAGLAKRWAAKRWAAHRGEPIEVAARTMVFVGGDGDPWAADPAMRALTDAERDRLFASVRDYLSQFVPIGGECPRSCSRGSGVVMSDLPPITIRCEDDEHAHRVATILETIGYPVVRDIETPADLSAEVGRAHKLTAREQDVLDGVVRGWSNERIAREIDVSRATVKWHMHNVFAKTNTGTREDLLRLVLTGPRVAARAERCSKLSTCVLANGHGGRCNWGRLDG
jgi:DNA-binding CsgD family transcriptional regulator